MCLQYVFSDPAHNRIDIQFILLLVEETQFNAA